MRTSISNRLASPQHMKHVAQARVLLELTHMHVVPNFCFPLFSAPKPSEDRQANSRRRSSLNHVGGLAGRGHGRDDGGRGCNAPANANTVRKHVTQEEHKVARQRGRRWWRSHVALKSAQEGLHPSVRSGRPTDFPCGHHRDLPRRPPDASALPCAPSHPTRRRQPTKLASDPRSRLADGSSVAMHVGPNAVVKHTPRLPRRTILHESSCQKEQRGPRRMLAMASSVPCCEMLS